MVTERSAVRKDLYAIQMTIPPMSDTWTVALYDFRLSIDVGVGLPPTYAIELLHKNPNMYESLNFEKDSISPDLNMTNIMMLVDITIHKSSLIIIAIDIDLNNTSIIYLT